VNAAVVPVPIGRVEGCAASHADDLLAVEEALEIRLGNRSLTITMRTPGNDFELAAGFPHSEGMIRDISQIRSMGHLSDASEDVVEVELDRVPLAAVQAQRNFVMSSACVVCGKASLQNPGVNACPICRPTTSSSRRKSSTGCRPHSETLRVSSKAPEDCTPRRVSISAANWSACARMSGGTMPWIN